MSEAIGQLGRLAPPDGHRRDPAHRRRVLPAALAHLGGHHRGRGQPHHPAAVPARDQVRSQGEEVANGVVLQTATWAVGIAGLVTALAGLVMFLVLTGAITWAVAAEVAGEDPGVEQSYRFGFQDLVGAAGQRPGWTGHGGRADLARHPGIYIGVRLQSIEALVVEGRGTQAMGRSWELVGGHWWQPSGPCWWPGCSSG